MAILATLELNLSSRLQIVLIVAVLAVVAAGSVVGVTLATRQTPDQPKALPDKPPLGKDAPDAGGRADPRSVRRVAEGRRRDDGDARPRVPEGPRRPALPRPRAPLGRLPRRRPGVVLRRRRRSGATRLGGAGRQRPPSRVPGRLPDVPSARSRTRCSRRAPPAGRGQQHSALRAYEQAARAAPNDDEAQVAVAVARFDKDNLNASFSRLGPLTRKFPKSQSVRFYLGLLLAWTGQRDPAIAQFQKAVALGPGHRRSARDASRSSSSERRKVGPTPRPNEPVGLWRPSGADATVPARSGGGRIDGEGVGE